ncbi:hypothetical protein ACFRCW_45340 [Streptomyces sp. NPDC056653]
MRKGSRGRRPPGFDEEWYKKRNTIAHRYVHLGTATAAALAIWLRT